MSSTPPDTPPDTHSQTLEALRQQLGTLEDLSQAGSLIQWDQHTYMPTGGGAARAQQLATLGKLSHERLTDPTLKAHLETLEAAPFAEGSDEAALLREVRRGVDQATKLPGEFVERFTRLRSLAQGRWAEARAKSDFAQFAPVLEEMLEYTLRQADYLGYDTHPYDALHDLYEPGSTVDKVRAVFAELREATVPLVRDIVTRGRDISDAPVHGHFDEAKQEQLGKEVVADFGYDFTQGRLDRTVHPFATRIGPGDVRITTRYQPDFLNPALFGTMHEAGHGMYEQGLPEAHGRNPLGHAASLGLHESQSRLWENLVGRSHGFWQHLYPRAQELFPSLQAVALGDFYAAINKVEPSLIRVEADEITYNLHIMIRFELELALLEGALKVADLPEAWNAKYQDYLGITPPDDAQGCLQDVHWSMGGIGYFPTYTLGNIISVQLFEAAKRVHPEIEPDIAAGRFDKLLGWMRDNVHRHGSKYLPADLLRRATGSDLDPKPYIAYLNDKFRALYGL